MCTLIVINRAHGVAPLIIAANRDELYARPTEGITVLRRSPLAVGGRDLRDGGTWMGFNETGLFVGLTNIYHETDVATGSRGELVLEMLGAATSREAVARLEGRLAQGSYRPFNLLVGTASDLQYCRQMWGQPLEMRPVAPGVHVLPSTATLDCPVTPKVRRAQRLLNGIEGLTDRRAVEARLIDVLADHHTPDTLPDRWEGTRMGLEFDRQLQALCVHTPVYGTRSSMVAFGWGGAKWRLSGSDSAACHREFTDFSGLFSDALRK